MAIRLRKIFSLLALCVFSLSISWAQTPATADPAPPRNMGNAGEVGKGPVIDSFTFEGNKKVSSADLAKVVQLKPGMPLSSVLVQPDLERITAYYKDHGGAYVQPSIIEQGLNHAKVIFQIHEGAKWYSAGEEPQPAPAFFNTYWDNTMVCAAAQTSNDLCHMWLMKDGSFIIFDPNGVHRGKWKAGKVLADGRVPICRYWEGQTVQLPPEIVAAKAGGPTAAPSVTGPAPGGAPSVAAAMGAAATAVAVRSARICKVVGFQMQCTTYPDASQLEGEQKRIAGLGMVERNKEIGSCYSHGPHPVGEVWFEWDDYAPGQLGLDRQMLLPGHQ
ncbi:MAG: POTRA domain-containing protein [Steroidobacteraceae bacterium]